MKVLFFLSKLFSFTPTLIFGMQSTKPKNIAFVILNRNFIVNSVHNKSLTYTNLHNSQFSWSHKNYTTISTSIRIFNWKPFLNIVKQDLFSHNALPLSLTWWWTVRIRQVNQSIVWLFLCFLSTPTSKSCDHSNVKKCRYHRLLFIPTTIRDSS